MSKNEFLDWLYKLFYVDDDDDPEYYSDDEKLIMIFKEAAATISEEHKRLYEENHLLRVRAEELTLMLRMSAEDRERMADMIEGIKKQISDGKESD